MFQTWVLLFLLSTGFQFHLILGITDTGDGAAMIALKSYMQNTPPNWSGADPCGSNWDGVSCSNSRVIALKLSTMSLRGFLPGDIGSLTELQFLDLSFNQDLGGSIPKSIENLKKLTTLILAGCSFSGTIPDELGSLQELAFLALNTNKFTGRIPASLGKLSKLYWFDLADNQLTGGLPVSDGINPGLDMLLNAKHFHFNQNQLSGLIPPKLFSSNMVLIHILFDSNNFSGSIPSTMGHVKTLEVLRLDRNSLTGPVPTNLNNLSSINELHLSHNRLTGAMPDLTGMDALNYVDLSNNSFDQSTAPSWFPNLQPLTTLIMEFGNLVGEVPQELFSLRQLQQVRLRNNGFNVTLNMGNGISPELKLVDLQNNDIPAVTVGPGYKNTLILIGNPVCDGPISNTNYCHLQQGQFDAYSTSLASCGSKTCPSDQKRSPLCICAYPYGGIMTFRAPSFSDVTNATLFRSLEQELWTGLGLTPGSVFLQNPNFDANNYLRLQVDLFPPNGETSFNITEVQKIGFDLSSQVFKPSKTFGPYFFIADPYIFPVSKGSSMNSGVVIGIAVGCSVLVLILVGVGIYAIRQKKRAERALELSKPFASWAPSGKDSGGAPQLKGARWFSYDELKKCTNNFSENNETGSGGYGKVYRGILPSGQMVAIKRSQQGSMQGGLEFKTEIELLSRVHHKNLVGLVGFCFEQGEQMLVYEFVPNGTLRESLTGKTGIYLDWKRRLRITLGSARGLAYLHELANPPIIHRDVKSTNILLDENLNAKVADFGLSKLVADTGKGHVSTQVKGTLGYLDPEYYMTQQLTDKSDVYSFGVVMLELLTARQPIEKGKYIVREVRMAMENAGADELYGLRQILDPNLGISGGLMGFRRFVELAMKCVEESASDRPTMSEVVKEIESILQNDGLNTNSTSASSSATDFGIGKGAPRHPYDGTIMSTKESSTDAFQYSGGYSFPNKVEPK
ncbi:hypothetical protein AMTRI_Chr01g111360 [Amborella trichopoda]